MGKELLQRRLLMEKLAAVPRVVGETTLTSKNQISLPARSVREMGLDHGDRFIVQVLGDDMIVLVRRPQRFAEAFAGRLTDVFGTHEETIRWLDDERDSWHREEHREEHRESQSEEKER
jgi:bifunctional DNA-binding transcriptional regulator/antitoxin component of YhaV-PrlF toxin-antitoxin module